MKKRWFLIGFIIFIIILVSVWFYKDKSLKNEIKNSYNEFVVTNKETSLFIKDNDKFVSIGTLGNNLYLNLTLTDNNDFSSKYFNIKDTDYYIYYKDIDDSELREFSESPSYYVSLNKKIVTNDVSEFYQDNNLFMTINKSMEFDVLMTDDNYYYVKYLEQIFGIAKNNVKEVNDTKSEYKVSDYISVLYYNSVSDNCNDKACISINSFKEQLSYLKDNGYYTISIDDYKLWVNDNINLNEKAILLTSKDNLREIANDYNMNVIYENLDSINFKDDDQKSLKNSTAVSRYNIINKTDMNIFKKIVSGENISYPADVVVNNSPTLPDNSKNATSIAVLNYHFFYDPSIGEDCNEGICEKVSDFENQLKYLKENNYKTLTMEEFRSWMYGEIELPARSVLLTVDDGAMGTGKHNGNKLIPLLEKYSMHATLFLITGWWDISNYQSEYLDVESHSYDMHEGNYCNGVSRGSKMLCLSHEKVLEDLKKSIEITKSKTSFCFPLYAYNESTINAVKESGFSIAFVGGGRKASRNDDKFKIPRFPIQKSTSLEQFVNMIN